MQLEQLSDSLNEMLKLRFHLPIVPQRSINQLSLVWELHYIYLRLPHTNLFIKGKNLDVNTNLIFLVKTICSFSTKFIICCCNLKTLIIFSHMHQAKYFSLDSIRIIVAPSQN